MFSSQNGLEMPQTNTSSHDPEVRKIRGARLPDAEQKDVYNIL